VSTPFSRPPTSRHTTAVSANRSVLQHLDGAYNIRSKQITVGRGGIAKSENCPPQPRTLEVFEEPPVVRIARSKYGCVSRRRSGLRSGSGTPSERRRDGLGTAPRRRSRKFPNDLGGREGVESFTVQAQHTSVVESMTLFRSGAPAPRLPPTRRYTTRYTTVVGAIGTELRRVPKRTGASNVPGSVDG
jgi:hypothetical protein